MLAARASLFVWRMAGESPGTEPIMSLRELLAAPHAREAAGITLSGLAILMAMALFSYSPTDPSFFAASGRPPSNWIGPTGAQSAALLYETFGLASWFLPMTLFAAALRRLRSVDEPLRRSAVLGLSLVAFSTALLLCSLIGRINFRGASLMAGGTLGELSSRALTAFFGDVGAILIAGTMLVAGLALAARSSLADTTGQMAQWIADRSPGWRGAVRHAASRLAATFAEGARRLGRKSAGILRLRPSDRSPGRRPRPPKVPKKRIRTERISLPNPPPRTPDVEETSTVPARAAKRRKKPSERARAADRSTIPHQETLVEMPPPEPPRLPPVELLAAPKRCQPPNKKELLATARHIESRCAEFSVEGSVQEFHPGPVVTTYEFKPDAGVKLSRITALSDDLALGLEAESVRIDRIPGRPAVGIEVPNRVRETISLRAIIESHTFRGAHDLLTMSLGKTQEGEICCASLARMPHLLIAGSTGSGKSVGLNAMITSILYRARPEEVRFILIDPKMLELGVYEGLPHLLVPVVTDMKLAANALRWAVREMERRYRLLASCSVRHIDAFNALVQKDVAFVEKAIESIPKKSRPEKYEAKRLPFIVIVVDELADMLMTTGQETEEPIARLAQKARAVGIHLILATQRPSVDVLTGAIKTNFPARCAFRVASKIDSRTILDAPGAERLLGAGDMLYRPPGSSSLHRVHGPFLSEQECLRVVAWLKKQARAEYDAEVLKDHDEDEGCEDGAPGSGGGARDSKYRAAVRLVIATGRVSTSFLQRRMKIGYSRAARIVDEMEADGIIGPADGSKAREILVDDAFLERMAEQDFENESK